MADKLPPKPKVGENCNGCGICCIVEPCAIAYEYISTTVPSKPCPALELESGRFWCGMVRHPTRHMDRPVSVADECQRLGIGATVIADKILGNGFSEMLGRVGGECDGGDSDDPEGDPFLGLTGDVVALAVFSVGSAENKP